MTRNIFLNGGNYNRIVNGNYCEQTDSVMHTAADDELVLQQIVKFFDPEVFPLLFDIWFCDDYGARFTLNRVERFVYGSGEEFYCGYYTSGSMHYDYHGINFDPQITKDDVEAGLHLIRR